MKNYGISDNVIMEIQAFARMNDVQKVILFGSRARGDNTRRSDIDIAVTGGNFDSFYWDVMEKTNTLLMFDIIDMDNGISEELKDIIKKEGIVIYAKAR